MDVAKRRAGGSAPAHSRQQRSAEVRLRDAGVNTGRTGPCVRRIHYTE